MKNICIKRQLETCISCCHMLVERRMLFNFPVREKLSIWTHTQVAIEQDKTLHSLLGEIHKTVTQRSMWTSSNTSNSLFFVLRHQGPRESSPRNFTSHVGGALLTGSLNTNLKIYFCALYLLRFCGS